MSSLSLSLSLFNSLSLSLLCDQVHFYFRPVDNYTHPFYHYVRPCSVYTHQPPLAILILNQNDLTQVITCLVDFIHDIFSIFIHFFFCIICLRIGLVYRVYIIIYKTFSWRAVVNIAIGN